MSKNHLSRFVATLGENQELFEQFKNLNLREGKTELLISFAKEAGFKISEGDLNEAYRCYDAKKLSDEDLDMLASGKYSPVECIEASITSAVLAVQQAIEQVAVLDAAGR